MLFLALNLFGQTILEVANSSRYVGKGRWNWTVYINAPEEILRRIERVEYHLHPTFPNPIRIVDTLGDPRYPWGYSTNGWGIFQISVKIIYLNGRITELPHMLKFESLEVEEPLPIRVRNVARSLRNNLWGWTVFIRGPEEALEQILLVEYTLHPDILNNVREVPTQGSGVRTFSLSDKSSRPFQIRIRVFLRNGRVQYLNHVLIF
jgi:transcription initiation factor IIF auxiliary subunit